MRTITPEFYDKYWEKNYEGYVKDRTKLFNCLSKFIKGKVADLGCGVNCVYDGTNPELIIAIDISEKAIQIMKNHYDDERILFKVGDCKATGLEKNYFDVVILGGMFHLDQDINKMIEEAKRICKSDGIIVLTVPRRILTKKKAKEIDSYFSKKREVTNIQKRWWVIVYEK